MPKSIIVPSQEYTAPEGDVYTPTGDSASFHWTNAQLNVIGAWTDLDVSGAIPAGANAALFGMLMNHAAGGSVNFRLRPNGATMTHLAINLVPPGEKWRMGIVPIPADRKIEYFLSVAVNTRALYVAGVFK